mgnify:FL=1
MGLTRLGVPNESFYKWKITIYDLETDTEKIDKYFSIKHFNEVHNTDFNADHVQKLKKLKEKYGGDYSMDDVRNATPKSVLRQIGHIKFEKIKEPLYRIKYKTIKQRILIV